MRVAACVFFMSLSHLAHAQVVGFSPADYGKAQLPMRQSTGDAATFIEANKGAFEPVSELDAADPLAAMARPVGRVDIVLRNARTGAETGASCTGVLLAGDLVLTNHHCLPVSGDLKPVKASILMNYLTLDGKAAQRYPLAVQPLEADGRLDYAIARAKGQPTAMWGSARIAAADSGSSRSLIVIHHPMGRPKVMSRFRCMALKQQSGDIDVRHRCDTLGGSSGSLMFDAGARGVALHKEGGLDPRDPSSFNAATSMAALLEASPLLRERAAAPPDAPRPAAGAPPASPPSAPPAPAADAPIDMNAILRGPSGHE